MTLTYQQAIAAAQEAGDQLMRKKDLQKWDDDCWKRAEEKLREHDMQDEERPI